METEKEITPAIVILSDDDIKRINYSSYMMLQDIIKKQDEHDKKLDELDKKLGELTKLAKEQ